MLQCDVTEIKNRGQYAVTSKRERARNALSGCEYSYRALLLLLLLLPPRKILIPINLVDYISTTLMAGGFGWAASNGRVVYYLWCAP